MAPNLVSKMPIIPWELEKPVFLRKPGMLTCPSEPKMPILPDELVLYMMEYCDPTTLATCCRLSSWVYPAALRNLCRRIYDFDHFLALFQVQPSVKARAGIDSSTLFDWIECITLDCDRCYAFSIMAYVKQVVEGLNEHVNSLPSDTPGLFPKLRQVEWRMGSVCSLSKHFSAEDRQTLLVLHETILSQSSALVQTLYHLTGDEFPTNLIYVPSSGRDSSTSELRIDEYLLNLPSDSFELDRHVRADAWLSLHDWCNLTHVFFNWGTLTPALWLALGGLPLLQNLELISSASTNLNVALASSHSVTAFPSLRRFVLDNPLSSELIVFAQRQHFMTRITELSIHLYHHIDNPLGAASALILCAASLRKLEIGVAHVAVTMDFLQTLAPRLSHLQLLQFAPDMHLDSSVWEKVSELVDQGTLNLVRT